MLDYARLRAELNGQVRARLFSNQLGKASSGNKSLFTLPVTRECKWVWATPGLRGPCPPQGFGVFLRERMMQSKWNKRSVLVL